MAREGAHGYGLFTTKDPGSWNWDLENLGQVCAEAWDDGLLEEDRAWAERRREKFARWIDDSRPPGVGQGNAGAPPSPHGRFDRQSAPPWPMLLEAVQSAFFVMFEALKKERPGTGELAEADPTSRLHRTYFWRMLTSDDTAEELRAQALRAFRRGFRIGRRGKPKTLTRPIPPMLKPPVGWGAAHELPGPSAARDRAIRALPPPASREELASREEELRALYASAWREDVPEEDRIWAAMYRDTCTMSVNYRWQRALAQSAYEGFLQSSDGRFGGEPARPWMSLSHRTSEPWCSFVDRVVEAPEGESDPATTEAAVWEYWDTLYREAPPWDSDPDQAHWLAALRAARRKAQADDGPPEMAR
ncbi:hypothetical protein BE15_40630 [Sorangium cellulosum]|uniref:Uncharacterized protein n=2 Tax=Polyangiaceae TaxID=49 RepID=A0A150Q2E3_SORCE|nr:hypothetical protein BE15_40630 [Sorangium cellulosum]